MGISKVNGGSSYPNQGDRNKTIDAGAKGGNVVIPVKSKPAKTDAKVWHGEAIDNPAVPEYLA